MKKIKCSECIYFKDIENTSETKQGICTYTFSYEPTGLNDDCHYIPDEYKCGDCMHYLTNDTACMIARYDDPVIREDGKLCCGFEDKYEDMVKQALFNWELRGLDTQKKLENVFKQFKLEFREIKRK